jgi:hypothetical protein
MIPLQNEKRQHQREVPHSYQNTNKHGGPNACRCAVFMYAAPPGVPGRPAETRLGAETLLSNIVLTVCV